jgi:hypothetical protein
MDRHGIEISEEVAAAARVPEDLDASAAGPYSVPTTRRRRAAAAVLVVAAVLAVAAVVAGLPAGILVIAGLMVALAAWGWAAAWPLEVSAEDALAAANRATEFPVGHASAGVGFEGWRARPVWNVLVFSADDPPSRRGLVRVDGVGGEVIETYVEDNPEV